MGPNKLCEPRGRGCVSSTVVPQCAGWEGKLVDVICLFVGVKSCDGYSCYRHVWTSLVLLHSVYELGRALE